MFIQGQKCTERMSQNPETVPEVASHALFGRLLFVYALNGVVKCFSADEIRPESAMLDIGWKHTATIDPARWIEAMANGTTDPSDMLDELQFCPANAIVEARGK
jgi:hypothetical protein